MVHKIAWQAAADRQEAEDLVQATYGRKPHAANTAAATCARGRLSGVPGDGCCGLPGGDPPAAMHRSRLSGGDATASRLGHKPPPWARG